MNKPAPDLVRAKADGREKAPAVRPRDRPATSRRKCHWAGCGGDSTAAAAAAADADAAAAEDDDEEEDRKAEEECGGCRVPVHLAL
jgi:hypothetical protein